MATKTIKKTTKKKTPLPKPNLTWTRVPLGVLKWKQQGLWLKTTYTASRGEYRLQVGSDQMIAGFPYELYLQGEDKPVCSGRGSTLKVAQYLCEYGMTLTPEQRERWAAQKFNRWLFGG